MKKLKLIIGLIFISISILGLYPIAKASVLDGRSKIYQSNHKGDIYPHISQTEKDLTDTNYPIFIGLFALSGAILLGSIKNEK